MTGVYRAEIIPRMESGRYGAGKVYRFMYCPSGSHVFYTIEPKSKTSETVFEAEGYTSPNATSAKLVFIQPDGTRKINDIELDSSGKFSLSHEDIIREEGINSYYIITYLGDERCEEIKRAIMYDISFAGAEKPYIKGEKGNS
jgi:hypothetical protein